MNQTTRKIDLDDKRMKIDQFNLKKTILSIVRGDQSLYIDSQISLQVQLLIVIVFFFLFSDPFFLRGLLPYIPPFE